jgi:hypothetical protein
MRAMALTQTQQFYPGMGLTTTKAPFIEVARSRGELYIEQPYELYSEENHEAWRRLYARIQDRWQRYATEKFLEGVSKLCLDPNRVPRLDDVNRFLRLLFIFDSFDHLFTLGFSVLAVAGGGRVAVGVAVRVAGVGCAYLRCGLGSCDTPRRDARLVADSLLCRRAAACARTPTGRGGGV